MKIFSLASLVFVALNASVNLAQAADQMVDFTHLKHESARAVTAFPLQDECKFSVKEVEQGIELSLQEDEQTSVKILVTDADAISVSAQEGNGGSYKYTYTIANVGALTLTHVEDAYNSIELADGKFSARCLVHL